MRIAKLQIGLNVLLFLISLIIENNFIFFAREFPVPIVLYFLSATLFLLITTVANYITERRRGAGNKTLHVSLILGILNVLYWQFLFIVTLDS